MNVKYRERVMKMKDNKEFIGYVGTYTKENSEGIYKFTLDTEAKN